MDFHLQPLDTAGVTLPADVLALTELLARHTHDTSAHSAWRRAGVTGRGATRAARSTPGLVSYDELSESEKEYDWATALEVLRPRRAGLPHRRPRGGRRFLGPEGSRATALTACRGYRRKWPVSPPNNSSWPTSWTAWRIQRAGAVEAEIFYAARLLEVLAAEALRALG